MSPRDPIVVAAIQPALRLGAVEQDLRRVEGLVRDVFCEHDPALIVQDELPALTGRGTATSPRPADRRRPPRVQALQDDPSGRCGHLSERGGGPRECC